MTWRDGDRLLAFGHPFLGTGRITLPLAPSETVFTVPSLLNSFKISRIGPPAGTMLQDRLTAISGIVGPPPAGLPLELTVLREGRPPLHRELFIARDPYLTPPLADLALRLALMQEIGSERTESMRLSGRIALAGGRVLTLGLGAPGGSSNEQVFGSELNRRLAALMRPPMPLPEVERIELSITAQEPDGAYLVRRVMPDRLVARPGDTVRFTIELSTARGEARRETVELGIPRTIEPGSYTVFAGSPRGLVNDFGAVSEARRRTARDASDYLAGLDDSPSDDTLAVILSLPADGLVSGGREYPALPGSAHLLLRSRPGGAELYRSRLVELARAAIAMPRGVYESAKTSLQIVVEE